MECSSIKLVNRKEVKKYSKINRRKCQERSLLSAECHRIHVPKKTLPDHKCLSVKVLELPENLESFNTGASMQKWCEKRPRLKSSKVSQQKLSESKEEKLEGDCNDEETNRQDYTQEEEEEVEEEEEEETSDFEIDPDVRKLIKEASQETEARSPVVNKKRSKRRRKKSETKKETDSKTNETKTKPKKTKIVKYAISKPPSPQTVQVIRVKVTSNYSFEEKENDNVSENDCTRGHGRRFKRNFMYNFSKQNKSKEEDEDRNIEVECRKLVLSNRKLSEKAET